VHVRGSLAQHVDDDASDLFGTRGPSKREWKPVEHSFKTAFTMAGELMVELLEPLEGEGICRDFLNERGESIHHLGHVRVDDLEQALGELEEAGFPCIETGRDAAGFHTWAYVDTTPVLGYILELSTGFDPRAIFEEGLSEEKLRSKLQV